MKISFPDGNVKEFEEGIQLLDVAKSISEGFARSIVGAEYNGQLMGLQEKVYEDGQVNFFKYDSDQAKQLFWHTTSHLMAAAIQKLFPDVLFAIGPAIENGFYYDIDSDHQFVPEDLEKIEKEMLKIAREKHDLVRKDISRQEALDYFQKRGDKYKVELINDLPEDANISIYELGDFIDLCKGPHLLNTKDIKAVKLLSIAGAYWKGDSNNKMLQRIYGISFNKQAELDEYLNMLEEAKKRDHRLLGKQMDLFMFAEQGPGFPFYLPKGMILKNQLQDYLLELLDKAGYGQISTPMILNEELWHTSGHWDHYAENMYFTEIDEEPYAIKPMNCPGSILVYKSRPHSYRDLPIRLGELGLVHRHELSGALHGLFRVRAFTQDDAHVFCLPSQVKDEIKAIMSLAGEIYSKFGFKYKVYISTRPEDYMGTVEQWDKAEKALIETVEELNLDYEINEADGAFYGPKIDIQLFDSLNRPWQCGTVQLDFQMPQRFDIEYTDEHNEKSRPVMIHRAIYGSLERFIGILIEHYAGNFPLWLAPVQASFIPVSVDVHGEKVEAIYKKFKDAGLRVEFDGRNESMGKKIRDSQTSKIPYQFVFGDKELEENTVSVRKYGEKKTESYDLDEFLQEMVKAVKARQ
ncbi:threonine--tRNA ligase [uncultured Helcococcus sp.]|uniref:threonine--tRNA ligase n=1 Tax=uncultured Helcococcus sp. TaxID=1072508 RepID=UPI00262D28B4|nr:threonine--tRNA ligase [uncultured Helcococcus sp.]